MRKVLSCLLGAMLCFSSILPIGYAAAKPVVLNVDGKTVTLEEFNKIYKFTEFSYQQQYGKDIMTQTFNGTTVKKAVQSQLLQNLVQRELINRFLAQNKIAVDTKLIEQDLNAFMASAAKNQATSAFYKANGIDRTFLKSMFIAEYKLNRFKQHFTDAVTKNKQLLEKSYALEVIEVDAAHILAPDEATANQLLTRIKAGEPFATIAKESSLDTGSANMGGNLGYFKRGVMVPEFEAVAFATPVGQISAPVKSQFGYHLILVNDRKTLQNYISEGADPEKIAELKEGLIERLALEQADAQLKKLEKSTKITKYPNLIK